MSFFQSLTIDSPLEICKFNYILCEQLSNESYIYGGTHNSSKMCKFAKALFCNIEMLVALRSLKVKRNKIYILVLWSNTILFFPVFR